jgi:hypothetical protein
LILSSSCRRCRRPVVLSARSSRRGRRSPINGRSRFLLLLVHAFSGFMKLKTSSSIQSSPPVRKHGEARKEYVRRTGRLGIAAVAGWPEPSNTLLCLPVHSISLAPSFLGFLLPHFTYASSDF